MARTYKPTYTDCDRWNKAEYLEASKIHHLGYCYSASKGALFETLDDYFGQPHYRLFFSEREVSQLKKAIKNNNMRSFIRMCYRPWNLKAIKPYSETQKRKWRQSFNKNKNNPDFESWDSLPYPKLKSNTIRLT